MSFGVMNRTDLSKKDFDSLESNKSKVTSMKDKTKDLKQTQTMNEGINMNNSLTSSQYKEINGKMRKYYERREDNI